MAVILDRIMNYQEKSQTQFNDLGQAFYTDAMLKANKAGIILGDGKYMRPKDSITREEASVMIGRAFNLQAKEGQKTSFADDNQISSWAKGYIGALAEKTYVKGKGANSFDPLGNITRGEAVKIFDNIVKNLYNKAGTYTGDLAGTVVVNTKDVTLENMTIDGDLIIAEGIGEGEVYLNNVQIKGSAIVKGGGENSIVFNSVTVEGALIVKKEEGKIRIVATGNTQVKVTVLESGAILLERELQGGGFENVEIPAEYNGEGNVQLQGNFTDIESNYQGLKIEAKGKIDNLKLNKDGDVSGTAEIKKVEAASGTHSNLNGKELKEGTTNNPSTTTSTGGSSGGSSSGGNNNPTTYTVTFDSNGGTSVTAVSNITSGNTITLPTAPTKTNYTFKGWYTDNSTFSNEFTTATAITANITVYAKWEAIAGWQQPVSVDQYFETGYPKASINNDDMLELKIKLKDTITANNPAEVFMVIDQMNTHINADVQSVIHGHTGTNETVWVDAWPYAKITDNNEKTITTDVSVSGHSKIRVYFVVKVGSYTSTQPTEVTFEPEVITELDNSSPYIDDFYINKDRTAIYGYAYENLDLTSVPAASAFTLTGVNGAAVTNVELFNVDNEAEIKLTVTGINANTDISNLEISYTAPSSNPIQDKATTPNKAESFSNGSVLPGEPVLDASNVFVSQDKKYIRFCIRPGIDVRPGGFSMNELFTLKYGANEATAQAINLDDINWSYNSREIEISTQIPDAEMSKVTDSGQFYIKIANYGTIQLTDYAKDVLQPIEFSGNPTIVQKPQITSAEYVDGEIKLIFDRLLSDHSIVGCAFTLKVNNDSYQLRGFLGSECNNECQVIGYIINEGNMYFDIPDGAVLSISYTPDTSHVSYYELITDMSGRPLDNFENQQITNNNQQ